MKYFFVLTVIITVTMTACKKQRSKGSTEIHGVVLDAVAGTPIPNYPILILANCPYVNVPEECTTYKRIFTDNNGNYSFSFIQGDQTIPADNGNQYYMIELDTNPGYAGYTYRTVNTENSNTINFSVRKAINLFLHLKVLRHDRGWLRVETREHSGVPPFSYGGAYSLPNPSANLDTIFKFPNAMQGLIYDLDMQLSENINNNFFNTIGYQLTFPLYSDTTVNYTIQ